jgi:signal transduction histidine kinase
MNMLYQLLLARKKEFDYLLLFASVLILSCSIILNYGKTNGFLLLLKIISPLLLGFCLLCLWLWYRYSKYAYYAKRIRHEYMRVLYQQEYKIRRLTELETDVLICLLKELPAEEMTRQMKLTHNQIYLCIENLLSKFEIKKKEGLLDIDWKSAII